MEMEMKMELVVDRLRNEWKTCLDKNRIRKISDDYKLYYNPTDQTFWSCNTAPSGNFGLLFDCDAYGVENKWDIICVLKPDSAVLGEIIERLENMQS